MARTLATVATAAEHLPSKPNQALSHLPGPKGHWLGGNVAGLLGNIGAYVHAQQAEHGDCFTVGLFRNRRVVMLVGPEANELVLLDREQNFSSRMGWDALLDFFGRNVLLRDFDDHRQHRRLMTHVFKPQPLARYLKQMNPTIQRALVDYHGDVEVYARTKQLALAIAIEVFAGIADGSDTQVWNRDLNLVLSNAMAHKIRLPCTRFSRGLAAKRRVHRRLLSLLPARREHGGDDLFSQLASQQDEAGTVLSDADVIDHMFGMLFAAHDTTASSLAMICWLLGRYPVWQERLRAECQNLARKLDGRDLSYADLDQLVQVEWVFKEALRMYAPLQLIPRRSVVPFEFSGHRIPENTALYLIPQAVHMNPEYYPDPHTFDPTRFAPVADGTKNADPFTFVPFGRGSHMCLGMHFAYMEIKAVVYQLLLSRRLTVPDETLALEYLPIVRPTKPMVVYFEPI